MVVKFNSALMLLIIVNINFIFGYSFQKNSLKLASCFQQARDIFFAIDGTASVGSENFAKVRLFLEQFTKDLDLRAEKIRFGLLEFSDDDNTEVLFDFESAENREDVVSSLRDMQYHNIERRSIELALRIIKAFIFTGTDGDRPETPDLLVVLMNGRTENPEAVSVFSEQLHVAGVKVITVAVGPKPETFLDQIEIIASSLEDILTLSFGDLNKIGQFLSKYICDIGAEISAEKVERKITSLTSTFQPTTMSLSTTIFPPTTIFLQTTSPPTTTYPPTTVTSQPTTTYLPTTTNPPTTAYPPTTTNPHTTAYPPSSPKPLTAICDSKKSKYVLFLVDSTKHVPQNKYTQIKFFLRYAILRMFKQDTRFLTGVMQFSDGARTIMDFVSDVNNINVNDKIENMRPPSGLQRFTGNALVQASKKFYEVNIVRDSNDVQDVIILITNGKADDQDKVIYELDLLKARNVKVIVVAVGDMRKTVVLQWRTIVNSIYVFSSSANSLHQIFKGILSPVCSDVYLRMNYPPASFHCKSGARDVFFAVDGSASIGYKNFKNVRKLIQDLIYLLKRKKLDLHIGLMQFSETEKTKVLLKLGIHLLESEINIVQSMAYQSGERTNAGNALSRINKEVFNKYGGDRPYVADTLILLTDGNAHDLMLARVMADKMKERGIRIVGIAAGPEQKVQEFRKELEGIASSKKNVFTVNFLELATFSTELLKVTCE